MAGLRAAGYSVAFEPAADGGVFTAQRGPLLYEVELRVAREMRRAELSAALADSLLRARAAAGAERRPLAVVGARRLSPGLAAELRAYGNRFLGGDAFGLVDAAGRLELHGPGLEETSSPEVAPEPKLRATPQLFSDRGQWLLKVLLAPAVSPRFLEAPREPVASASGLARAAQVSVPCAARWVAQLKVEGHLQLSYRRSAEAPIAPRAALDTGPTLQLVARAKLLERFRAAAQRPVREIGTRWIVPAANPRRQLLAALAAYHRHFERFRAEPDAPFLVEGAEPDRAPRACLGLFSASAELGFSTASAAPAHLYLEEVTEPTLSRLGLEAAPAGAVPQVRVRVPACPEALFRAAVTRAGVKVADALQCWLDVAGHPSGGDELAAALWRDAVGAACGGEGA